MPSAATIRLQVEAALAHKIHSALTPAVRMIRPVAATGIEPLDRILKGGLPVGAISELTGPECSGRTSVAMAFLARMTESGKVGAWVDVSNTLNPDSVAAAGIDLARLLWVRCGVLPKNTQRANLCFALPEKYLATPVAKRGLHGGGFGPHPRTEAKGLPQAIRSLLRPETIGPRFAEPQRRLRPEAEVFEQDLLQSSTNVVSPLLSRKPWSGIEQALRATDLLLQGGGFSTIVLDMGSLAPEDVLRVPLATWYRYRAAAEKTQSSILLLSQHPCAKSSAELVLRLQPANAICDERTVFTGIESRVEVVRQRFTETQSNVIPLRKPPQGTNVANWQSRTAWAGRR